MLDIDQVERDNAKLQKEVSRWINEPWWMDWLRGVGMLIAGMVFFLVIVYFVKFLMEYGVL